MERPKKRVLYLDRDLSIPGIFSTAPLYYSPVIRLELEILEMDKVARAQELNPVETKLPAMFVCEHRPLKQGETPKRRGQDTVFEATGAIDPQFLANWDNHVVRRFVTIKHDGMCSKLVRTENRLQMFRRYDVRKGQTPPPKSVPAGTNHEGTLDGDIYRF